MDHQHVTIALGVLVFIVDMVRPLAVHATPLDRGTLPRLVDDHEPAEAADWPIPHAAGSTSSSTASTRRTRTAASCARWSTTTFITAKGSTNTHIHMPSPSYQPSS